MVQDSVIQFEGTIYEDGYGLIAQRVMRDKSLPKQSKLIYSYMCSFAGVSKNGEPTSFPSVSLQCAELGMSESTYFKWRKTLIDRGLIEITQRQEGAKFDRNIYSVLAVVPIKSVPPKNLGATSKSPIKEEKEVTLEQDQLLKGSLRDSLPEQLYRTLSGFSNSYEEMYKWMGILFRAKAKAEKEQNQSLLLEHDVVEREIHLTILSSIRAIRQKTDIQNPDHYLFMTLFNRFTQLARELT